MFKKGLLGLSIFVFFISIAVIAFTHVFPKSALAPVLSPTKRFLTTKPSPTPFPFQELTIPYLQNRSYKSLLHDRSVFSETGAYTSYLTSYDSDGLRINALLTIPKTQISVSGYPAVVFVHGYIPPNTYRTTEKYESYVDYLARNGIVVFKIDLRGHGDSEGEASGAYYSGDYVIDVLNAYAALEEADFIDKQRISLWGHSMAGNVVLRAVAAKKTIPKAVIWAGAVYTYEDLAELRISDDSYTPPSQVSERSRKREELSELYGYFSSDSWFWQMVPPTNYLQDVQSALQVHHAVNDDVVSVEYSRNLDKIMSETAIDFELFEYATGGHNMTGQTFIQAMQRTVEFLR